VLSPRDEVYGSRPAAKSSGLCATVASRGDEIHGLVGDVVHDHAEVAAPDVREVQRLLVVLLALRVDAVAALLGRELLRGLRP
jgi:hypothetical protein